MRFTSAVSADGPPHNVRSRDASVKWFATGEDARFAAEGIELILETQDLLLPAIAALVNGHTTIGILDRGGDLRETDLDGRAG